MIQKHVMKAGVVAGLLLLAASPALAGTCWDDGYQWWCSGGCQITHWSYDAYGRPWAHWSCPNRNSSDNGMLFVFLLVIAAFIIWLLTDGSSSTATPDANAAQGVPQQVYTAGEHRAHEAQQHATTMYWLAQAENHRLQIARAHVEIQQLVAPPTYQQLPPPTPQYLPPPSPQPQAVPPAAQAVYQRAAAAGVTPQQLDAMLGNLPDVSPEARATIVRLYRDDAYRERVVGRVTDRTTRAFWELEYGSWDKQQRADYPVSLLNKVRAFVASPAVRAILCQRTPRLDLRKRLDLGGITVVNVSKGIVGAQVSSLIGAFFVSYLVSTALSRADQPEEERTPVRVHIDEAQTVSTGAMESLLSECRKFGTQTCLANQTLTQLTDEVRAAILTNARTLIAFNTSAADEDVLAPEIAPGLSGLAGQLPYHAVIRRAHLVNRIETTPFRPSTTGRFETVRAASRMRFAREKKVIERGL